MEHAMTAPLPARAAIGFPWLDHFVWRDACAVQQLRVSYTDHAIVTNGDEFFPNIARVDLLAFLERNPPPIREAA
jgi:hypothetical protein